MTSHTEYNKQFTKKKSHLHNRLLVQRNIHIQIDYLFSCEYYMSIIVFIIENNTHYLR